MKATWARVADFLALWLRHSDARQVFDLPAPALLHPGSPTPGHRPVEIKRTHRQVRDLPRIGVAKPLGW